jgi:hypothetical protein
VKKKTVVPQALSKDGGRESLLTRKEREGGKLYSNESHLNMIEYFTKEGESPVKCE